MTKPGPLQFELSGGGLWVAMHKVETEFRVARPPASSTQPYSTPLTC
jgi:hypothetical protein